MNIKEAFIKNNKWRIYGYPKYEFEPLDDSWESIPLFEEENRIFFFGKIGEGTHIKVYFIHDVVISNLEDYLTNYLQSDNINHRTIIEEPGSYENVGVYAVCTNDFEFKDAEISAIEAFYIIPSSDHLFVFIFKSRIAVDSKDSRREMDSKIEINLLRTKPEYLDFISFIKGFNGAFIKCPFCQDRVAKESIFCKYCSKDLRYVGLLENVTDKEIEEVKIACSNIACGKPIRLATSKKNGGLCANCIKKSKTNPEIKKYMTAPETSCNSFDLMQSQGNEVEKKIEEDRRYAKDEALNIIISLLVVVFLMSTLIGRLMLESIKFGAIEQSLYYLFPSDIAILIPFWVMTFGTAFGSIIPILLILIRSIEINRTVKGSRVIFDFSLIALGLIFILNSFSLISVIYSKVPIDIADYPFLEIQLNSIKAWKIWMCASLSAIVGFILLINGYGRKIEYSQQRFSGLLSTVNNSIYFVDLILLGILFLIWFFLPFMIRSHFYNFYNS